MVALTFFYFAYENFESEISRLELFEIILNIYLIINNGLVTDFKVKSYEFEGGDDNKIKFLKEKAKSDFTGTSSFDAPTDKDGNFMSYNKFAKLEKQGMHFSLFEHIFSSFNVAENPLICVTPVVDGELITN